MARIRRINLFGPPGCGKSTLAAGLFYHLKKHSKIPGNDLSVELVQEYVKQFAYEGKVPTAYDQFYIFTEQLRREEHLLRNGVELIVTDCPLFLNCCYGYHGGYDYADRCLEIAQQFEKRYASFNLFVHPDPNSQYVTKGRYQNKDESKEMGKYIEACLGAWKINCTPITGSIDPESLATSIIESKYIGP